MHRVPAISVRRSDFRSTPCGVSDGLDEPGPRAAQVSWCRVVEALARGEATPTVGAFGGLRVVAIHPAKSTACVEDALL